MRTMRAGICALIAFAVLAFGADPAWAQLVLEAGAAALLIPLGIVALRRREVEIRVPQVLIPAALLLGIGLFQLISGISAYRYATELELARDAACVLLAILWVQAFRDHREREAFVWFLLGFVFAVSLFAIVQHFAWNGKIYWIFDVAPGGWPFGPYVNSDHFAGFVELTVPLGMALLFGGVVERDRVPLLVVLTIVPIGALVLTASRAGIAGFLFETAFLLLLQAGAREHKRIRTGRLRTLGFAAAASLFVIWLGVAPLLHRIGGSTPAEISHERRFTLYRDSLRLFLAHPLLGTGLGAFRAVYPRQESYWDGRIVVHAHSDCLELLAEAGVAGWLCGAAFIVLLLRDGWRLAHRGEARERVLHCGALAACAGLLVHDLADFNLHLPANALLFLVLASLASTRSGTRIPAT